MKRKALILLLPILVLSACQNVEDVSFDSADVLLYSISESDERKDPYLYRQGPEIENLNTNDASSNKYGDKFYKVITEEDIELSIHLEIMNAGKVVLHKSIGDIVEIGEAIIGYEVIEQTNDNQNIYRMYVNNKKIEFSYDNFQYNTNKFQSHVASSGSLSFAHESNIVREIYSNSNKNESKHTWELRFYSSLKSADQ